MPGASLTTTLYRSLLRLASKLEAQGVIIRRPLPPPPSQHSLRGSLSLQDMSPDDSPSPISTSAWGIHRFISPPSSPMHGGAGLPLIGELMPSLDIPLIAIQGENACNEGLPGEEAVKGRYISLRPIIMEAFRKGHSKRAAASLSKPQRLDQAFLALRLMAEQQYLHNCTSVRVTDGIRVEVTSRFDRRVSAGRVPSIMSSKSSSLQALLASKLGPEAAKEIMDATASSPSSPNTSTLESPPQATPDQSAAYIFTYRVCITNLRHEAIRVLGRSWTIRNDKGMIKAHVPLDPSGNALVGQQPLLPPLHSFEYYSGTDLDSRIGVQSGKLLVEVLGDGRNKPCTSRVVAEVAPFPLMQQRSHFFSD